MAEKDLEKIREKLYDHEEPADVELWQDIQDSLHRRKIRRVFYRAASCAAVIAAIFLVLTSVDRRRVGELEYFAQMFSSLPVPASVVENSASNTNAVVQRQVRMPEENGMYQIAPQSYEEQVPEKDRDGRISVPVADKQEEVHVPQGDMQNATQETKEKETAGSSSSKNVQKVQNTSAEPVYPKYNDNWADEFLEDEVVKKRYAIAFTGGLMPGSSASVTDSRIMAVSAADNAHQGYIIEQVSDTKYSLPLNLGVQLQFPIGENMALGVGVSYTMLKSKFDCLVNKVRYSGSQTLHYVGIPVNVYGVIAQRNNFMFYVNGGAMLEKGVRAKYKFNSYKDSYSNSTKMDGLQFSINAGLGVEYKLADYAGLYFEPNLIYFTNSDMQYCIRTDQPLQIKAELGCRFHF